MIFDTWLYNGEPIADFRIRILEDVVDHFVIVEGATTFTDQPKPFYAEAAAFYDHPKVSVLRVTFPPLGDAWSREHLLRQCCGHAVRRLGVSDGDLIVSSDVDEIPDPEVLVGLEIDDVTAMRQDFFYYNANWKKPQAWTMGTLIPGSKADVDFQQVRGHHDKQIQCGWHLSYADSVEGIQRKLKSFSHTEFSGPKFTAEENVRECLTTGRDLFYRQHEDCVRVEPPEALLPFHNEVLKWQQS